MYKRLGFTIVEIIVVIIVVSILASITIVGYSAWIRNAADSAVQSDVAQAGTSMKTYNNTHSFYPHNLAGTDFAGSQNVAITIYTNAPIIGVYTSLTPDQNAQLLLNVCNANLSPTLNTACTFAGNKNGAKIHVKGTQGSNTIWSSPIAQADVRLTCGSSCTAAAAAIVEQFLEQGGTFPVIVKNNPVPLPNPTQTPNGPASKFCIEGRHGRHPDIVHHTTSEGYNLIDGPCPEDPELHYFPNP